jgi:uncharacterized protein YprB with RNaseH-like and TPR domain
MGSPKVLFFDVETTPITAYVWGLFDQNISLDMIKEDWTVLSWAAKWLDSPTVMYRDQRNVRDIKNDKELLRAIWSLLDKADVVVTQNGRAFDQKKLNARFVAHGLKPVSSFKHIDTLLLAKRHFAFTSNKLQYMTDKLCTKYKKLDHKEFPGFEMWKECLAGNIKAWRCMETYNRHDVLSLEELYTKLIPWDSSINFNLWNDLDCPVCKCGGKEWMKYGFAYTQASKFQRYQCKKCGAESRSGKNLFTKEDREKIRRGTVR